MSLVPMDFSEESQPLSPGVYNARIIGQEVKYGKEKGTPYVNWTLETFGSPAVNGKRVYYMTMLSGQAVSSLAEFHKAATGEEIDKKQKQYDPEMLIGREITATITHREYQGRQQLQVKAVAPLSK